MVNGKEQQETQQPIEEQALVTITSLLHYKTTADPWKELNCHKLQISDGEHLFFS